MVPFLKHNTVLNSQSINQSSKQASNQSKRRKNPITVYIFILTYLLTKYRYRYHYRDIVSISNRNRIEIKHVIAKHHLSQHQIPQNYRSNWSRYRYIYRRSLLWKFHRYREKPPGFMPVCTVTVIMQLYASMIGHGRCRLISLSRKERRCTFATLRSHGTMSADVW